MASANLPWRCPTSFTFARAGTLLLWYTAAYRTASLALPPLAVLACIWIDIWGEPSPPRALAVPPNFPPKRVYTSPIAP